MENSTEQTQYPNSQTVVPEPELSNTQPTAPIVNTVTPQSGNTKLPFQVVGFLVVLALVAVGSYFAGLNQAKPKNSLDTNNEIMAQPMVTAQPLSIASPSPLIAQSSPSPAVKWKTYSNTAFNYSFSYPENWKVTTGNYAVSASTTDKVVQIFNPDDRPEESFFSGMTIEYVGMGLQDTSNFEKVTVNGVNMLMNNTSHGPIYYANIPDTDSYLQISGAGGNTSNEETNSGVKKVLASFKWIN